MGCGMSTEDKEGKARNEEIENQLKRDKMMQRNEIKMLLLGMCHMPRLAVICSNRVTRVTRTGPRLMIDGQVLVNLESQPFSSR